MILISNKYGEERRFGLGDFLVIIKFQNRPADVFPLVFCKGLLRNKHNLDQCVASM